MDFPPAAPGPRRPVSATAAGLLAMLYGVTMSGGGAYGALWLAWWSYQAEEGDERGIGLLGIVLCLVVVHMGRTLFSGGRDLLRGHPFAAHTVVGRLIVLLALSGVAMAWVLLDMDLSSSDWGAAMTGCSAVFGLSLAAMLLCEAEATKRYLAP